MEESKGSLFYSFAEAAKRLGRSVRSVQTYANSGRIRRSSENGRVVLHREDVEQLAIELETDMPALTRQNFYALMARVQRLEQDMAVVKRQWEIQGDPLHPEPEHALGLWKAAEAALQAGSWGPEEIEMWSGLFDRFDEETLDVLASRVDDPKPYLVFFNLCSALQAYCLVSLGKKRKADWVVLYKKLGEGRKKIRAVVLTWIEMGKGTVPVEVLKDVDTEKEALLRSLSSQNGKS